MKDNQFTQKSHLTTHIQSKHEGIKNVCDQCDYRATQKSHLITHIQSKHEGIRYACDQCNFQAKHQSHLTTHIQSKHEGIKYECDQCDYQATLKCNLTTHILFLLSIFCSSLFFGSFMVSSSLQLGDFVIYFKSFCYMIEYILLVKLRIPK